MTSVICSSFRMSNASSLNKALSSTSGLATVCSARCQQRLKPQTNFSCTFIALQSCEMAF